MSQNKKWGFYLTGVNHIKAHHTQLEHSSGVQVRTMKNVAVVTNLRIYHWTIKQSCSAGNGTHWTHVPWCVQSHVKTQLTFWQHPPFLFSLGVLCSCASLSCVWSLLWLGTVPPQLRLQNSRSFHWTTLCSSSFGCKGGITTDMHDMEKVGFKSADFSKVRGFTVVLWPRGSPACIWDDLPIVRAQRLPCPWSGLGVCLRSTSSDTGLQPIHHPSLCTEVTAGIQLFVKGL